MCDQFISDRLQIIKKQYMEANNNAAIFFYSTYNWMQMNENIAMQLSYWIIRRTYLITCKDKVLNLCLSDFIFEQSFSN